MNLKYIFILLLLLEEEHAGGGGTRERNGTEENQATCTLTVRKKSKDQKSVRKYFKTIP